MDEAAAGNGAAAAGATGTEGGNEARAGWEGPGMGFFAEGHDSE